MEGSIFLWAPVLCHWGQLLCEANKEEASDIFVFLQPRQHQGLRPLANEASGQFGFLLSTPKCLAVNPLLPIET